MPVNYTISDAAVFSTLQGLSSDVIRPPQDAAYVFADDKSLSIQDGTSGVSIDVAATVGAIRSRVGDLSSDPVEISTKQVKPAITAKTLQPGLQQANQMVSTPFTLTNGGSKWQIPPETLREMVEVNTGSSSGAISISESALKAYVTQIAGQVKADGQNAGVRWDTDHFAVIPSTNGEVLDASKTAANIVAALQDGKHELAVAVTSSPAPVVDADAQDAIARAQQMVSQPLTLTWTDGKQDLTAAQLASVMTFNAQPDQSPKIAIGINQDAVSGLLDSLRSQVETPAKDADLRYLNGAVTVVSAEQNGTSA